jgi:putative nucleotidyltransferase with HDIG domain
MEKIDRATTLSLLKEYVKNDNMIKHSLASEAVMRAVAVKLEQDPDLWGAAGLIHDIDVEITEANLKHHCKKAVEILNEHNYSQELIDAVRLHNEHAWENEKRETVFQKALAASETITGLVMATTFVYPDRKLASVKTKSVIKRMKELKFAASVNREIIRECEDIGIPLAEFAEIAVTAMREISDELDL